MAVHTYTISITQNSQNTTNNTSNVTVSATAKWDYGSWNHTGVCYGHITIDGTKYSWTNLILNPNKVTNGSQVVMTKTVDVSHNSDGTKTLSCSSSFYTGLDSSGTKSASASKTLTQIPRKSTMSVANGTLGTAQTLTVTRNSTSFTHTITYTCGDASGTICTKSSSTSVSWTPPLSLAAQNTTGTSVSVKLTITTYNGSTSLGSNSYTKTYTIPTSVVPTVTISVSDSTGYSSTYGGYIQGVSKMKVALTGTGNQGSTIKSYKTTANGKTYTSSSFTTDVISSSGTLTIKSTVTDSRGRTGTKSSTITAIAYSAPKITKLSVARCDSAGNKNNKGDHILVTFSASVTSLSSKNTASYSVEYKKSSSTTYTSKQLTSLGSTTYTVSNSTYIFAAETGSSYDIRVVATDKFNSTSSTTSASSAFTLMSWLNSGLGMAIGKVAELPYVFDIALRTRFVGGILHPVLEPNTNLDDVRIPNTYVGANTTSYNYQNCPITSGTFTLEVVGMGDEKQCKQRLTSCNKTAAKTYERIYYQSTWGDWFCVSDFSGTLLWSGGYYMTAGHTATLSGAISKQRNGIVLVFSEFIDGAASDTAFHCKFVPKHMVILHPGKGHCFQMSSSNLAYFATKYLYIYDTYINGNDNNNLTGDSTSGIARSNTRFVLRYVIGV